MDFLPILYALLAAITGVNAGDRATMAVRAPVESSAISHCAVWDQRAAALAARVGVARYSAQPVPPLRLVRHTAPMVAVAAQRIFTIAGFAVRRQ
ncbi:MAG: hypothetical protein ACKOUM_12200 [Sphingopyxis sp.]